MDRLTEARELLDGPLDDPIVLAANLRDLARINRLTCGARLSERGIASFGDVASLLDVGTGAADIPMRLLRAARRRGQNLIVTATDSRLEVLAAARVVDRSIEMTPGLVLSVADGRHLPYPDASFEVVHASLVLHHLDEAGALAFLGEMRRVARRGIVVNDLARSVRAWLGGWILTHTIAASRYTRHDGPLSVRRAWTLDETVDLVRRAGLTRTATFVGFAGHRYAIAAR